MVGYVSTIPTGLWGEVLPAVTLIEHWLGRWSSRSACSGRGGAGAGAVAAGGGPADDGRHGARDGRRRWARRRRRSRGTGTGSGRRAADAVEEEAPMSGAGIARPRASHAEVRHGKFNEARCYYTAQSPSAREQSKRLANAVDAGALSPSPPRRGRRRRPGSALICFSGFDGRRSCGWRPRPAAAPRHDVR